ncbi:MAG: hypothetical protein DLM59_19135 [Pseudonocardiales bacterium]|nr:MAG: hypothetical protein DLM59_19135 [Pseudonocardiales bacterium]
MVGFTHHGSPLSLFERLSVPRGERGRLREALRDAGSPEAVVLSTCSHTEIHAGPAAGGPAGLLTVLAAHAGCGPDEIRAAAVGVPGVRLVDVTGMNDDAVADPRLAAAIEAAVSIVGEDVRGYADDAAARRAGPVIAALRQQVENTCLAELTRVTGTRTIEPDALARAAHAIAGKLLHRPTITARTAAAAGDTGTLLSLCEVFGVRVPGLGTEETLNG